MKVFRKYIVWILPVLAILLISGLILTRVFRHMGPSAPQISVSSDEASEHIGTRAEVCGDVASASYLPQIGGEPTFINLGRPHPDQDFTVVIWGSNRSRWSVPPDRYYSGRYICVTGTIRLHEGTPQIVVTRSDEIQFESMFE